MIEKFIRKIILEAGTDASDRIYPTVAPQDVSAYPIVVYQRISTERPHSHTARASGLGMARIQVRTWARTYSSAKALGEQVRLALDGYRGVAVIDGKQMEIQSILAQDDLDDYDDELRVFGTIFDILVSYTEDAPA